MHGISSCEAGSSSIKTIPIIENQMDRNMGNEMDTCVRMGLYRDPGIQVIHTLGPEVCKYHLYTFGYLNP